MPSHKFTCQSCGYVYHSVTGSQQETCPECGERNWLKELTHP